MTGERSRRLTDELGLCYFDADNLTYGHELWLMTKELDCGYKLQK